MYGVVRYASNVLLTKRQIIVYIYVMTCGVLFDVLAVELPVDKI